MTTPGHLDDALQPAEKRLCSTHRPARVLYVLDTGAGFYPVFALRSCFYPIYYYICHGCLDYNGQMNYYVCYDNIGLEVIVIKGTGT